jgi:hypothetical protein
VLRGAGGLAGATLVSGCDRTRPYDPAAVEPPPAGQPPTGVAPDGGGVDGGAPVHAGSADGSPDGGADVAGTAPGGSAHPPEQAGPSRPAPDAGAPDQAPPPEPIPDHHPPEFAGPRWVRDARVAGLDASLEGAELAEALDAFADQGVSVVELDSRLSYYLDDAEFEAEAVALDAVAGVVHARGMKAVIYFPSLEALTADVAEAPGSMAGDHADWLQIDIAGRPMRFVGEEGGVFWVDPGTESAWLCPSSGYTEYFLARVARLARTQLDGLWADVPLLSDLVGEWACTCPSCRARFRAETGLELPAAVNFDDATFRRWASWRHRLIWDFEQKIAARARQVRPDFQVIVETVSMDYTGATRQGLDPTAHDDGPVLRVWEVDAVSDRSAMRRAGADDWLDMAVMMRHGAGCSAPRPSWVFCYGDQPDDAEYVFALAVATGNNPFELKVPLMDSSVGEAYRQQAFRWLAGDEAFFAAYPLHQVAVLYSSASRDFLDRGAGNGLYTSVEALDEEWWSTDEADSTLALSYVGDYRGWCRALINAHQPYDMVPAARLSAEALARYRVLVVPSAIALSDAAIGTIARFAREGGTVLASGPDLGRFDDDGRDRGGPALLTSLMLPAGGRKPRDKGLAVHVAERAGLGYLRRESTRARMEIAQAVRTPQIVSDAPAATVFSVRRTRDGRLLLAAANLDGLGTAPGSLTPRVATFQVALALAAEGERPRRATRVVASQPGQGAAPLPFSMKQDRVVFSLTCRSIAVVTIGLE